MTIFGLHSQTIFASRFTDYMLSFPLTDLRVGKMIQFQDSQEGVCTFKNR